MIDGVPVSGPFIFTKRTLKIIGMIHVHPAIPALQALQQTLQDCVAAKSQLHALNALVLTKALLAMAGRFG